MKWRWTKYAIRAVAFCLALWVLLAIAGLVYVRSHKERIIAMVRSDIASRMSGKIAFEDLSVNFFQNFPRIAFDLRNVSVTDSLYSVHRHELLHVQHCFMGFGILDLFHGSQSPKYVALEDGNISLFVDSNGYKNWDILRKQPGTAGIFLRKVSLRNIDAIFQDQGKFKFYHVVFEKMKCAIRASKENIRVQIDSRAVIRDAAFNTRMGSYLANKRLSADWRIIYSEQSKKISLTDQVVRIDNLAYRLSGNFFIGNDPYFNLSIQTDHLPLPEAASIFPPKTGRRIDQFKLSKPILEVRAFLAGPMKYSSFPLVRINFSVDNASLEVSPVRFDHCSFRVLFRNVNDSSRPPDDRNSVIKFTNVTGEWEKNAFDSRNISFYNLLRPYLKCEVHCLFKLARLEKAISSRRLDLNGGDGTAELSFSGPLAKADTNYALSGRVDLHDADIRYNPRNLNFRNTDMQLLFQNGDIIIRKMNTVINDNRIRIDGKVRNFLNFFSTDSSKADFEWNLFTPQIDIGKLTGSLHRTVSAKKNAGYSFFDRLDTKIDRLFDDCNAFLDVRADRLTYKNFVAENIKGRLTLRNDMIALDHFALVHAGGTIMVSASSKDRGNSSDLFLRSTMKNVNVRKLFTAFNSFGMQSLTSGNINGSFSADINLTSRLDARNNLYKPANRGYIDFSLRHGKLENFGPLMEIDNKFLQKRDLSSVEFAELKDRLDINGNEIRVHRMEIKSTAINLYVGGVYSFANNTDLSIQIPLRGQKKNAEAAPENRGNNSKGGISVFLRAKDDKEGKLRINYDLLGRFRNKK